MDDLSGLTVHFITALIPLIFAIAIHEWAHVAMARWLGDDLGTREGRFTLNPVAHMDPIWTLALPSVLIVMSYLSGSTLIPFFAAGKPAPYNPIRLDREFGGKRIQLRTAELLVAVAGPVANVVLAILTGAGVVGLSLARLPIWGGPDAMISAGTLMLNFFALNIALAVFNMLPIPPLDGSKVLMSLLPRDKAARYEEVASKLSYVLLAVIIFGGGRFLISPVVAAGTNVLISVLQLLP